MAGLSLCVLMSIHLLGLLVWSVEGDDMAASETVDSMEIGRRLAALGGCEQVQVVPG